MPNYGDIRDATTQKFIATDFIIPDLLKLRYDKDCKAMGSGWVATGTQGGVASKGLFGNPIAWYGQCKFMEKNPRSCCLGLDGPGDCNPRYAPGEGNAACESYYLEHCKDTGRLLTDAICNTRMKSYYLDSYNNLMKSYCKQGRNILTDKRCVEWGKENPDAASELTGQYCSLSYVNLNLPECRAWCRNNPGKCDGTAAEYCRSIKSAENDPDGFCACYYPPLDPNNVYTIDADGNTAPIFPACYYDKCRNYGYLNNFNRDYGSGNKECPSIINCKQAINIDDSKDVLLKGVELNQNCSIDQQKTTNTTTPSEPSSPSSPNEPGSFGSYKPPATLGGIIDDTIDKTTASLPGGLQNIVEPVSEPISDYFGNFKWYHWVMIAFVLFVLIAIIVSVFVVLAFPNKSQNVANN